MNRSEDDRLGLPWSRNDNLPSEISQGAIVCTEGQLPDVIKSIPNFKQKVELETHRPATELNRRIFLEEMKDDSIGISEGRPMHVEENSRV